MARKKPEDFYSEVDVEQTAQDVGFSDYPNFGFSDFNFGAPADGEGYGAYSYGDTYGFGGAESADEDETEVEVEIAPERKEKKAKKKKKRKKESDYFHVNRKLPCFLITIVLLLSVLVVGIGALNAMPSMKDNSIIKMLVSFTALYRKPDMTPVDERVPSVDEAGEEVAYQDKSEYVTVFDVLLGTIKSVFGIGATEEEAPAAAAPVEGETDGEVTEDAAADGGFSMDTPFFDSIQAEATQKGFGEDGLPLMLSKYFGFGFALFALVALYYMLKSFAALFGKRVFKHFGLGAILMLVSAVVVLVGSLGVLSIFVSPAAETVELQFGAIMDFLMGAFGNPPEFSFILGEGTDVTPLPFVAGYGMWAMLILPVVTLLLSTMARKKLPYSIFD